MRKILITGKSSYIGSSLENWLKKEYLKYEVDSISLRNDSWVKKDFSKYDVVFHVAGIAHVSSDPNMENIYYKINRDLTIATAKKAKVDGVKQFIFMSSIIVYGDSSSRSKGLIDRNTVPVPSNFYGDSKLQAEEGIKQLQSDEFKVLILRPPMIYGKGSKGNYPRLADLAKKVKIFPEIENQRSMLHIDNLCEFLKLMIDYEESGLFYPQNTKYVKTSEMVQLIAETQGKKIWMTKIFNPILKIIGRNKVVNKVFGNLVYEHSMSDYKNNDYCIRNLKDSIKLTESRDK